MKKAHVKSYTLPCKVLGEAYVRTCLKAWVANHRHDCSELTRSGTRHEVMRRSSNKDDGKRQLPWYVLDALRQLPESEREMGSCQSVRQMGSGLFVWDYP